MPTPSCGTWGAPPAVSIAIPSRPTRSGDGFVIPVLYGTQSQWVRNVMAAGRFTLRTKGRDYQLERPEIIPPTQALAAYPALLRRIMRSQGIEHFVWAHRAGPSLGISRGR